MDDNYEYDFAYECRRLVEAMAPRPARSFRQEFNMHDVATEQTTYTSYTSEQYVRTTHTTELDGQPPIKTITNGKHSNNYTTKMIITEDDRPDVRNLKRVHKMYEGPNIIESKGIVHPETKEILTVGQAISMRILDVRTGRLLSSPETRQTMTIEQAAKEGLIDPKLAARLTGPCGMTEDGNEVTLLEAIQSELYDAEHGLSDPQEKRIKVNVETQKPNQGMSISDAVNRGQVDLDKGLYRLPNGECITIAEAYEKGYLIYNEIIKIKSSALSLSDAISQNLVDNSGWILDRNTGERFQLDVAIQHELINPNIREVVNPQNDNKITLAEAIENNIISPKHSKYINNVTKEQFNFNEAANQRFICKPMTLKDVCDNNLMTNNGKILSPCNKVHLNILEAIAAGVLDSDLVKCVTNTTTGQLLTLSEALALNIVLKDSKFKDNLTGEICTIPEAVDRGLITSVSQRSIFDIDGFRDHKSGEYVSFNIALSRGNIKFANGETFLKSESGDFVFLDDCTKISTIRPEVLEMFSRKIGIFENGKELSVLEAVFRNHIDPKTGFLLDSDKKPIPFNKAVEIKMITPEGAALLNSLLNITLTLQTVTKTVKRYVTVANTDVSQRSETIITFAEAVRRGLIDETTQTFTDPTTGTVFPIQQALDEGLLGVEQNEPRVVQISDRVSKTSFVPEQVVELKITKKSYIKDPLSPESKVLDDLKPETLKSPDRPVKDIHMSDLESKTSLTSTPTVTSLSIKKNTIELPSGGWTLKEAIDQKLFDPTTGQFIIPGTDRVLDLKEAVDLNVINSDSVVVVDQSASGLMRKFITKEVSLKKALDLHILDKNGHYKSSKDTVSMQKAIEMKLIKFKDTKSPSSIQKVITITSIAGMPDQMEISEIANEERERSPETMLEPVQVTPGVIYDPATALVISTTSGISENVLVAIDRGVMSPTTVNVVDPKSGKQISYKQAIEKGIINKKTGEYKDKSGKKINLADAAKIGLVTVVGVPLVAASKVIQIVKNTMVVDPNTGEKLPMEVAYERGLVDPVTYKKYEDSIKEKTPDNRTNVFSNADLLKPKSLEAAVSEGFIAVESIQSSLLAHSNLETPAVTEIQSQEKTVPKVKFSAQNYSNAQSFDKKPIILQKLRKRVIAPSEAVEKGLIDENTAKSLEYIKMYKDKDGNSITLKKAVELNIVDGNTGKVVDPIHGHILNINEALTRGILDEDGQDEVLIPLAKSLSIPEIMEQGLFDPTSGKIIHPETGSLLTLREAIICEVVDPLSYIKTASDQIITLTEAIDSNIIDDEKNTLKNNSGSINLIDAVNLNIFPEPKMNSMEPIPPAAMTLNVAISRKIVNPKTGEIKHPLTGKISSLSEAVHNDLIMAIPFPQTCETISLEEAVSNGSIDFNNGTFKDPQSKLNIPLEDALEKGLIALKPNRDISEEGVITTITETFTSQHTITTKMIELLSNYVLLNSNEVKNVVTNEVMSIDEARNKGIIKDEHISKEHFMSSDNKISFDDALNFGYIDIQAGLFTHPNTGERMQISEAVTSGFLNTVPEGVNNQNANKTEMLNIVDAVDLLYDEKTQKYKEPKTGTMLNFEEAIEKSIIDPQSVIYDIEANKPMTIKEAVDTGVLDKKTGKLQEPKKGISVDVKKAAKMGLLAVVASPVLAGMAIVEGVKTVTNKMIPSKDVPQSSKKSDQLQGIITPVESITPSPFVEKVVIETKTVVPENTSALKELLPVKSEQLSSKKPKTQNPAIDEQISDKQQVTTTVKTESESDIYTSEITTLVTTASFSNVEVTASQPNIIQSKNESTIDNEAESTDGTPDLLPNISELSGLSSNDIKPPPRKSKLEKKGSKKDPKEEIISYDSQISPHSQALNLEIAPGVFYNPLDPLVISSQSGVSGSILEAIDKGAIPSDVVKILDPKTGKPLLVKDAVKKGVINKTTGEYKDISGNKLSFSDALKLGLVAVIGAPVVAVAKAAEMVKDTVKTNSKTNNEPIRNNSFPLKSDDSNENILIKSRPEDLKTSSALLLDAERQPINKDKSVVLNIANLVPEYKDVLYHNVQLIEAINKNLIEPKICRIIIDSIESSFTVQDAIEQEQLSKFTPVDVISKNLVIVRESKPMLNLALTQKLTSEELAEIGVYDIEKQIFLNPQTGAKISFEELLYGLRVFNPEKFLVKDLKSKSDTYVSFDEAITGLLIDKTSGCMVNPKTNKKVPFIRCVQLGWIVEKPEEAVINEQVSIQSALDQGFYNPKTGQITDINSGALVSIGTAVENGLIDQETLLITLPYNKDVLPISDAVERGFILIKNGSIIIIETQEIIHIVDAIERGIINVPRRSISIEAIILQNKYDPVSGKVKDSVTEQFVTIAEAVGRNIVHPTISEIKDTSLEKFVPLSDALQTKLVDPHSGKLRDNKTGEVMPLSDALHKGLVSTKAVTFSLPEVIELGYYSPETCQILNPLTGNNETLNKAIKDKLVDPSDVKIKHDKSETVLSFDQAVKSGLVDLNKGVITDPILNLKDAHERGYILSDKKPWTLQEGLVQGFYNPETGLLTINDITMTLDDAIKGGIINTEALTIRNSVTNDILSLKDAIKLGLVDSKEGKVKDLVQGSKISLTDASDRGLILPAKRKISLPEAVFKGLYDPKTGQFSNTHSKEKLPTDKAIRKRVLDPQSTLVHIGSKVIPFEFAVDKGIINGKSGTITVGDEKVDFREAFERGILVEVRKPLSLIEAIEKGVYSEITGHFMDPKTGKTYTLDEAIKMNLVDPHSVHIQDHRSGRWDKITLPECIETGVVDNQKGRIKNINSGNEEISLKEAFEIGLLVDSKASISLQRALHQGLYDDSTGKIIDPISNRKITLHEAIRKSIINPKYLCYFDKKSEKPLSLAECCRSEIVDRRNGKFHEPGSDVAISLSEAMSLGLIVDIESAGFSLYETLAMNMYDITEFAFVHPVTERKISLKAAIAEELINPQISLVKNIPSSNYITLDEAIQQGIVDDSESVYLLPNGNQINLLDAKHRGLIVTSKKNLSLEEIIRNGLFRPENGKIVDPCSNEFMDINKSIEFGLLNPDSTIVKDNISNKYKHLPLAIEQGDVDITKGRVLDTKAKKSFSLDIGFDKGLLVTVFQPITLQKISKKSISESSAQKEQLLREFTLDEAIKYEFINPETALIKDPHKNKYIPLNKGIAEGIIDRNNKGSFDPQSGRSRALCFLFENGLIVYVKEPLTFEQAVELGHLNINTARFTDPNSKEVMTLKDATTLGYVDPDTALIKDNLKKRLVKLPDAFRKGLIDAEKGNILDTETSKLNTLPSAIESGLLTTPKKSFTLIETLDFGIYNPTTGALNDPFITTSVIDRKRLNLDEAIRQGIVDPSSTVVKEPETGKIWPLVQAIEQKLVDPVAGKLVIDPAKDVSLDLVKAHKKGYLLAAETRQAVEEKYRLCDETLSKLLEWIASVEDKLANQEAVKEDIDEVRNQINILKLIKDDLESHARQVSACADQAKQLLISGGDVLAPHEVAALERGVRQLKQRYDKCAEKCDKMLRRLAAARDELGKFTNEINAFNKWMEGAYRTLEEKEALISQLTNLSNQSDDVREFVNDVIAHQADLRFITMSAQKFVDESKEFLSHLNAFRTSLPARLPHVVPRTGKVMEAGSLAGKRHQELLTRASRLQERLRGASDLAQRFRDNLERANRWMDQIEPQVRSVLSEAVAGDPRGVESQLTRARTLNNEIVAQGRLIDGAKDACNQLVKSLEGNLTPSEIRQLEVPVIELVSRYGDMSEAVSSRCAELESALVQCQGLQDAAETQAAWLGNAETSFKNQLKPASLIRERLDAQIREHRIQHQEIEAHRPTLAKLLGNARDAALTPSNVRIAKKLEQRAEDIFAKFEKLLERSISRGAFLDEVSAELLQFSEQADALVAAHDRLVEMSERERDRVHEVLRIRDSQMPILDECLRKGKQLISMKDVTDVHVVRDRMKALENLWRDFNTNLEERQKLMKQRADQHSQYETLKEQVLEWLQSMETRVARLTPVALDLEIIKQQQDELRPLSKEYRDYSSNIDKVNEAGALYDALTRDRADSPHRKRQMYSPTKRQTPIRSLDARSPSPTKGHVVVSPGSTSSGFSSRRSSQDGFHLEDLSPVQQQLSEINNRYGLLGTKLSDRQAEIDNVREEMRKHLDSLRNITSFLDKVQRQLPKDLIPNTKEEADKTIKQARAVLEEMYEKQSVLDSTKTQVKELLKRKPKAHGAEKLHEEMEQVSQRWKMLHDHCKDKIRLMEEMKDFHDTHTNLSQWLSAKERMMAALGPISSDCRMVQTQVQQVQVLREEFRGQQPQLTHLEEVAAGVLERLDSRSADAAKLKTSVTELQDRWNQLLDQLEKRAASLGAAADTSREFDAGLNRLRDALQTISDKLDDLALDKEPEEQLRKIENLERQLEGQRPFLADLEAAGTALCDVLADPGSRQDITAKLAAVARQYDNLQRKMDHRKAEIEAALKDGRNLAESISRTLGWLQSQLGELSSKLQVSADTAQLRLQLDRHEPLYRDVLAREHELIMLLDKGRELEKKPAYQGIRKELDRIQTQWDKLKREAVDRYTRLQTAMEHCRKYTKAQESFVPWLSDTEERLAKLPDLVFNKKDVEKQLKELQLIRNDIWKRSGEYENNKTLGETFISACDVDQDVVRKQLDDIKNRWDRINNEVLQQVEFLETTARKLGDFHEKVRAVETPLQRCEETLEELASSPGVGPDAVDRVLEQIHALKVPLQSIQAASDDIIYLSESTPGVQSARPILSDVVAALAGRVGGAEDKAKEQRSRLAGKAAALADFNTKVKNVSHDISDLERDLEAMKPPGREVKAVKQQLEDVGKFFKRLEKADDQIGNTERSAEHLVDSGFGDAAKTRDQIGGLRKQLAKLDERARAREQDLDDTLSKLEAFYKVYDSVMDDVQEATDLVRNLKPVSSEVDQIRSQQKDFAELKRRTLEPLGQNVGQCNKIGQGLVRSASQGVSTQQLEKDLEKMNDKWNALKEKTNERERRLDVGLLQSGKFAEALAGLEKWLSDTEDMVRNQKPPSADYKVVKAQLQEQKFLKKMLLDRQNSMSSLFAMGNEVAANCEPQERKAVEKQLKGLMKRFDELSDNAARRMLDLEQAMKVAKQFEEQLQPLLEWLGVTERKVRVLELVPTDEEKIQQKIREHKQIHDDILSKQPPFKQLTETASTLMSLVGDDEATALADRLQEATDRYQALVDHSLNIGELLDNSRKGLRHLVLTYQDLSAWMDSMEAYLNKRKVLPVHMEKLLRQMEELAEKTEEIASKQEEVDSTVDSGLELMKHISGDEALQLKDKLDALQRRYNDLTSKGADLLRIASETLPLVQQFYSSHTKLSEWMSGAESNLQAVEPREEDILRLEAELHDFRPVLDNINSVGPQLCQISPGEGATHIEGIVTRDNRRFDAIAEQVQRKAERLLLSKKRSLEVVGDLEDVLEWLRGVEAQLRDAEPPSCEPGLVRRQLKEHRPLNDDVAAQRVRVRDLLSQAKKVIRECQSQSEASALRSRSEEVRDAMDDVGRLSADRLAVLEQALPLAEHFGDTHHGLSLWLDDMEKQIQLLAMPAVRPEQIAQQQDKNEMLQQSIAGHKPILDKLVKTGEALSRLCGDEDAAKIQDIVETDLDRYNALKAELRQRQQELEQALQESSLFSDKLEGMLRALANTADQVAGAEPVSAHPPKIEDQIEENNALVEDLDKRQEAYNAVRRAASDVISKANKNDPAVRDIRNKLEKLNKLWDEVQKATNDRGKSLDSALEVAKKFWEQLKLVMATLAELEDTLASQPAPAAQPRAIQAQQVALQEIRQEIDQAKPEVEKVRKTGSTLMSLCGEPDKPEVKKHMEDLDSAWDNITALYAKREENLIDAMEKAMEFHDTLQNLRDFLDKAEDKFSRMGPLGSDIDAVKRQISQLASFKQEVDPHMVKVEALNRQAQELTERTSPEQATAIKQPLTEVNSRWSALLRGMVERQQQLEKALLRLGQLQHALRELLAWIQHTSDTLDTLKPVAGDPQILEVELAKLKVLVNDIAAHQASVDTLNEAGGQLVQQGMGTDEAGETAEKLATLNRKWRELQQKARDRQSELEDALREAQSFTAEIIDLLSWLNEVDGVIAASKPVGGLPETASEQLERFMEVYNEIEANRPKVEAVLQQGQEYLKRQEKPNPGSQLNHNLKMLKSRWDSVTARASDKKIKLEIALKEATEFHDALQAFVDWLTSAEKTLAGAKHVSRVMETLMVQIEEHKAFQKEIATHRETMLLLDKKGTHLKYFSQKQDVILIKNLLVSVQHRWERVVSKAAERTRALDHGFKEAKEFSDMWNNLMSWLNETEEQLDQLNSETTVNDPDKIKQRLSKHREFQKALAAKQPSYDQAMKTGKLLKDKAPKGDEPTLRNMLAELKGKWTSVCSKAVDRQRKLEEALLYSGQFKDAMSALLEWLKRQNKALSGDSKVHGDLDTVMALIEQHKQFEEDLHSREHQMQSVLKTGRDLETTVPREDAGAIRQQCDELKQAWDSVQSLSENKSHRLEGALKEAEKLHKSVNMLLEWLSDAETKLRFSGQLPEGDIETQQQLREHEKFIRELKEKMIDKDDTIALAKDILGKAHPDAVNVIKHWITIIQSRWDEVWQWAMQRGTKLESHMQSLKDLDLVLEELLQWLAGLESNLISMETEPLPESIELLEGLIEDHKELMEHTQKRQTEVDRVCKAYQVKSQSQGRDTTPRKVSAKTATRATPGRGSQHDLNRERSVSPDYYGSRRYSRLSPGRETPDRHLPHYGPRFPAKGSKGSEPEFRSPRVKQLWDKWRNVWLLCWERQRRLHDRLAHLKELQRVSNFSWDDWRKRFLKFMNHKKSRLTDLFRKMDKDNNGLIPRNEFIDGIINTKFDTSRLEMGAVADLFDRNGGGLIDWEEFIAALRPDWVERRGPPTDADKIHDEVKRLVMLCTCRQKFRVFQVGEGKYRFGDSQKLRLVRILRSTVMVRVGGGWVALDEFLVKNDPCRAKGRTNIELREQFILADGVSQSMAAFRPRTPRSNTNTPPSTGPIMKVRERTARSVPMSGGGTAGRASRSSLSAGTPDSLSDNEAVSGLTSRYRKPSAPRSTLTPGGSRPGSRPGSRAGSKPPSRHGSNLSLDSTDDTGTPSRIPMRKVTNTRASIARANATQSKLSGTTPNGSRPRTPTGFLTPASGRFITGAVYRTSSIPTLSPMPALVSSVHSQPSSLQSEHQKSHPAFQSSTKIPIYIGPRSQRSPSVEKPVRSGRRSKSRDLSPLSRGSRKSEQRSPEDDSSLFSISGMTSDNECESNISESSGDNKGQRDTKGQRTPSGSTTPVRPGQPTAVSRLLRKPSDASDSGTPTTPSRRTTSTIEKREPFRL